MCIIFEDVSIKFDQYFISKKKPLRAILRGFKMGAGTGFEPVTFRLWAWRATGLLHPAINLTFYQVSSKSKCLKRRDEMREWVECKGFSLVFFAVRPIPVCFAKLGVLSSSVYGRKKNNEYLSKSISDQFGSSALRRFCRDWSRARNGQLVLQSFR